MCIHVVQYGCDIGVEKQGLLRSLFLSSATTTWNTTKPVLKWVPYILGNLDHSNNLVHYNHYVK